MGSTQQVNMESKYQRDMSAAIEVAAKRLIENGATRGDALRRIEKALSKSIFEMDSVGLGGTARLRRMMLTVGVKIEQTGKAVAGGQGARDGV